MHVVVRVPSNGSVRFGLISWGFASYRRKSGMYDRRQYMVYCTQNSNASPPPSTMTSKVLSSTAGARTDVRSNDWLGARLGASIRTLRLLGSMRAPDSTSVFNCHCHVMLYRCSATCLGLPPGRIGVIAIEKYSWPTRGKLS